MKANKFVAKLGNDTIINVYFYDTDGGRVVAGMGDQPQSVAPFDISGAKDVRVDLVDVMRGKRTKMSPVIDKHIMSIELNEDVQRIGEYFLDIRFGMSNGAFSDGVQAYRLKLSGIAIVESGETSGDIGATFDGIMVGGMSRAELLAEVEQLKQDKTLIETELSEMTEAKAQAESERNEANRAKTTAETERDEANKAKTTAESERDQALEGKAQAEQERDTAKEAQSELETRLRRNIQGVRNYHNKIGNISNEIITEVRDGEFERKGVSGFRLDNVTVVGSRAFFACDIESVDLPEATHIKHGAFQECNSLRVVKIPKVTTVDEGAFVNISSYSEVIVSEEIFDKLSSQTDSDNLKYFSPHPWGAMGRLSVTLIATVSQRRLSIYREV